LARLTTDVRQQGPALTQMASVEMWWGWDLATEGLHVQEEDSKKERLL